MAKNKNKKSKPQWKIPLGYSPAQETASGAGIHEKRKKYRRRDERRKNRMKFRQGDYD